MFKESGDDLPVELEINLNDFRKYRGFWLLWRTLGDHTDIGQFQPPISFLDALKLPKTMLDVFFELDGLMSKMERQYAKKKKGTSK